MTGASHHDGADPYVPHHGDPAYGVEHYDLELAYNPRGNRLDGTATLTCRALAETDRVEVDLHHLKVVNVYCDGSAVRWQHRNGRLRVTLPEPLADGDPFTLRVRYRGTPKPVRVRMLGEAGWEELTDGSIVAAQPHGAPSWFPCNDRPDDKATYACSVTVPAGYRAVFSGEEEGTSRSGSGVTFHFVQEAPMASYLATLQIGRYRRLAQRAVVPIYIAAPDGLRGPAFDASFGRQPAMMAHFVELFGRYPFDTYTAVITDDDLEIPLESQGMSTFGRNFVDPEWKSVRLIAHELAHQWFGNAVTLRRWRDIWLHEGFACYAEWLWAEVGGDRTTQEWADHHYDRLAALPQDLLLGNPGPADMFDDRVYKRGALTLHALRSQIGDDAFFTLLRRWVAEHRGGSVETADFVALCEEVTGGDWAGFFDAWLYATPLPAAPWRSRHASAAR